MKLTIIFEDKPHTGEDLEELCHHHGGRGQVTGPVTLQGARVTHGEHQGRGLEDQNPQREVFQLGWCHDDSLSQGDPDRLGWHENERGKEQTDV